MVRRLFLFAAIVAVAAVAFVASAGAGSSTTMTVNWAFVGAGATLPAPNPPEEAVLDECGAAPAGMWLRGTGSWTGHDAGDGGNFNSTAHGTAVDSAGNTYRWNYRQSIQPFGDGSQVQIVDDFVLSGSGPFGGIRSHFIATADAQSFEPRLWKGDAEHCDPI
jgi:hypothetical protein